MQSFFNVALSLFIVVASAEASSSFADWPDANEIQEEGAKLQILRDMIDQYRNSLSIHEIEYSNWRQALPVWFQTLRQIQKNNRTHVLKTNAKTLEKQLIDFALNVLNFSAEAVHEFQFNKSLITPEDELYLRPTTKYFAEGGEKPNVYPQNVWVKNSRGPEAALYGLKQIYLKEHYTLPGFAYGNIFIYSGEDLKLLATIPADDFVHHVGVRLAEVIEAAQLRRLGVYGLLSQDHGEVGIWIETDASNGKKHFFSVSETIYDLFGKGSVLIYRKILNRKFTEDEIKAGKDFVLLASIPDFFITKETGSDLTPITLLQSVLKMGSGTANRPRCLAMIRTLRTALKKQVQDTEPY